jgi:pimeloyl-ACP methyl ester carboxylesterase
LPGTELTVFPGAGHMLMLERPDEVSATLIGIVRRAAQSTARERAGRRRRARTHEEHRGYDQAA